MKEIYTAPKLELLVFSAADIIATSGNPLARFCLETPWDNRVSETVTDTDI